MPAGAQPTATALAVARYSLTIDGVEIAQFSDLASIASAVESLPESGESARLPLKRPPPTVTLKRGMNKDLGLWAWHETVVSGQPVAAVKDASLTMFGFDGKPVARYFLQSAWPSKVEIGALKAGANEVLYETVTLTCSAIQRINP